MLQLLRRATARGRGGVALHRAPLPTAGSRLAASAARSARKRTLPDSVVVTDRATQKIAALLDSKPSASGKLASGVRLGITNDWGSHTGFSYTLDFVYEVGDESDERMLLHNGATLFVDRKALWAAQGGLLGATLDIDDDFRVIVEPKE